MSKTIAILDCGCAIKEDGKKIFCPSCANSATIAHMQPAITESERVCVNALSGIANPAGFVEAAKEIAELMGYYSDGFAIADDPNGLGILWTRAETLRKAWKGSVEDAIAEIVKDVPDEVLDKMEGE